MYREISDFIADWQQESASTLLLFRQLTDSSLTQRIDVDGWNLAQIAWHLVIAPAELLRQAQVTIETPDEDAVPDRAADIVAAYQAMSDKILCFAASCNNEMLAEEINVFGNCWSWGKILAVSLRHQTHHRGQITVLARQAGLVIPGVCGPTRTEMAELRKKMGW